ncbi:hypothetical protein GCM10010244_82530 [Streptomyces coeruleorubidus]|nr:hypothetical protein GCM10010244_82530 [Streptomyces bellus]
MSARQRVSDQRGTSPGTSEPPGSLALPAPPEKGASLGKSGIQLNGPSGEDADADRDERQSGRCPTTSGSGGKARHPRRGPRQLGKEK